MKKTLIVIATFLGLALSAQAQKVGLIDTERILGQIPAYIAAQDQLNTLNDKYKATIENEMGKIETLYQNYQSSRSSMTAQQRQNAENEIISRERAVQEKQRIYFGEDGIMAKRAEELLTPIRDRVNAAVEAVAKAGGYDLVLDLAALQGVVYKREAIDLTNVVAELVLANENQ